jgi:FPC/CPF motif-containing protein YcgG
VDRLSTKSPPKPREDHQKSQKIYQVGIYQLLFEATKENLKMCVKRFPSNMSNQIKMHEPAVYPFQSIHADIGNYGGKQ